MKWLEKYDILSQDDVHGLERTAALYEFHKGLAKPQAEQIAYNQYKQQQLFKAAAFHLDGMEQSKFRADKEAGQRHYGLYSLHCQSLGVNPNNSISAEIQAYRGQAGALAKFVSHPADAFVLSK